jgi:Uma2 family endonuclease
MTALASGKETRLTFDAFLLLEEVSKEKHHFLNGNIIPMAGGTAKHNEICANIITALSLGVRTAAQRYRVYTSDMKIWIPKRNQGVYPDAVVVAVEPIFYKDRRDVITNPRLIVEVLSPGSEVYDRGAKFLDYQTLPDFQEYLLVSQEEPALTHAVRRGDDLWQMSDIQGIEQGVFLSSINLNLPLEDIYFNIF